MSLADDDDLEGLAARLGTRALGRAHEHHRRLASTNDRALAWAQAPPPGRAPHGALVTADAQSAGRGRRGRSWSSTADDLTFSLVLRPGWYAAPGAAPAGADRWGALGLAVAVGLREGLAPWLGEIALKWPNDLLWRGRKLAGILCEGRWHGGRLETVIIGVGVNVGRRDFADDPGLGGRAVSLQLARAAAGRAAADAPAPGRAGLLAALLGALEGVLSDFAQGGFPAIRGRYEPHCALLGRAVRVPAAAGAPAIEGVAEALAEDGALLLRPAGGGPLRRVDAADVWLADEAPEG